MGALGGSDVVGVLMVLTCQGLGGSIERVGMCVLSVIRHGDVDYERYRFQVVRLW